MGQAAKGGGEGGGASAEGLMIKSYPLIIANLITFALSLVILIIKIINIYKNK